MRSTWGRRAADVTTLLRALPDPVAPQDFLARALDRKVRPPARALRYAVFTLPVGRLFIGFDAAIVLSQVEGTSVDFEETVRSTLQRRPEQVDPPAALRASVAALAEGAGQIEYPVDLSRLGGFQRRVLGATRTIPSGIVRAYGWIARMIGAPAAARAVGTALARNPVPIVIPCHRVIRSDGWLGEYSGGGAVMKARILSWEGVAVQPRGQGLWVPSQTGGAAV